MTQFQIYSDLHIEFKKDYPCIQPLCDYLILAGDICKLNDKNFIPFMEYCSQNLKRVIYVLGNHEFYIKKIKKQSYYSQYRFDILTIIQNYKKKLEAYSNIHCLENEFVDITDDLRIYGSIIWTKPTNIMLLSDYDYLTLKMTNDLSDMEKK